MEPNVSRKLDTHISVAGVWGGGGSEGGRGRDVLNAGLKKICIWKVSNSCNEEPHAGPHLSLL